MATEAARRERWRRYHENFSTIFWARVDQSAGATECWPYTGTKRANGYGRFRLHGKYEMPHRMAYSLGTGEIPSGFFVCHHCDNPICCNPTHLFVGTHADNMADRNRKGHYVLPEVLREKNALQAKARRPA